MMWWMRRCIAKKALHYPASSMQRKVPGAQRPRHDMRLDEGAGTAQRSDAAAQSVI